MQETAYEALARVRSELTAMNARAQAAEMRAYDAYLLAAMHMVGLRGYDSAREAMEEAERVALQGLRLRRRYYEGLSPNVPPVPSKKAEKNGTHTLETKR